MLLLENIYLRCKNFTLFFISDQVDPNRDGYVSLQEYMAFMISKETENVQSSEEIEKAFRAITAGDRPYVTKEELYAVSYILFMYLLYKIFLPEVYLKTKKFLCLIF